jgi:hypothetical protein
MINGTVHMGQAHVLTQSTWVGLKAHGQKQGRGGILGAGWRRRPIPDSSPAVRGRGGAQELYGGVRNSNEALECYEQLSRLCRL